MTEAFTKEGLERLHRVLSRHIDPVRLPGIVALVSRGAETHIKALGTMDSAATVPMHPGTIFRLASATKPMVGAAAMKLVEDCVLRLDDPVDALLPELANRRVLRSLEAELDDTVPANRAITLRDLLTFRVGLGMVLAMPGTYPIQRAMAAAGVEPGPYPPDVGPDEWMRRLGELPLVAQPGERWMYDTSASVLGVLIARAAGQSLGEFLQEHIFEPLGMVDTGFSVPDGEIHRLAPQYVFDHEAGALRIDDPAEGGRFSMPPAFESGAAGLVSTARDVCAFYEMLLNTGLGPNGRVLSRASVELMTTNHLTPGLVSGDTELLPGHDRGWGFMMSVVTKRSDLAAIPGRFGWDGGVGTSAHADPANRLIGVLLTQVMWDSPAPPPVLQDFWTAAYAALA